MRIYAVSRGTKEEGTLSVNQLKLFSNRDDAVKYAESLILPTDLVSEREVPNEQVESYTKVLRIAVLNKEDEKEVIVVNSYEVVETTSDSTGKSYDYMELIAQHFGGWGVVESVMSLGRLHYKVKFKDQDEFILLPVEADAVISEELMKIGEIR